MVATTWTLASLVLLWLMCHAVIAVACRREIGRLWREPALRCPVLAIDSDDWGAGPLVQADALRGLAAVLARHRDHSGRPAVASLALVLAVPDGPAVAARGAYRRLGLDAPRLAPILDALRAGVRDGVFSLQLHGLEHYWPASLMNSPDTGVQAWLRSADPAATEQLPSHLQSRWIDATVLPSRPLAEAEIDRAVAEEVQAYARIVGQPPAAVVPPTFVWTCQVEQAWARHGIGCVVTPGRRSTGRDAAGQPVADEGPLVNGDRVGGVTYVARQDYFEPQRGRDAAHALRALDRAAGEGRPCLLENHRDNFIGDAAQRQGSLAEIDTLYHEALRRHSGVRFLATSELACILRDRDPAWVLTGVRTRLPFFWARLAGTGRLWRLLRLTGAAMIVGGLLKALAPPAPAAGAAHPAGR
jgi:hypothetical protein